MTKVTVPTTITVSPGRIWAILIELDRYEEWESGYVSSALTSEQREGVGATRRVELKSPIGVRHAIHEITRWEDQAVIAWRATETNFPLLATAEQTITFRAGEDGTEVENGPVSGFDSCPQFRVYPHRRDLGRGLSPLQADRGAVSSLCRRCSPTQRLRWRAPRDPRR